MVYGKYQITALNRHAGFLVSENDTEPHRRVPVLWKHALKHAVYFTTSGSRTESPRPNAIELEPHRVR